MLLVRSSFMLLCDTAVRLLIIVLIVPLRHFWILPITSKSLSKMKIVLIIFIFICLVRAPNPDAPNFCLPIQPISQDGVVQPRPEVIQGHPGKTGPRGPVGPQGSQGIPGECECNPSEIEQLRMDMREMNGKL